MASRTLSMFQLGRKSICDRCAARMVYRQVRQQSTAADAAPALLSRIKGDMKAAMRAKDTARLNVIRAIISETNQAASGSTPITSDMQVLALLKKRKAASLAAAEEAQKANREDLAQKQEKEIEILDDYVGTVKMMTVEELRPIVEGVVTPLVDEGATMADKLKPGNVMKELLRPGGQLEGKPVDKAELAELVRQTVMSDGRKLP